ncbi:MAG: hypothetical protein L3K26_05305 [Candidatus Hydrogenedentes bacterium]|nr:hypothetical protein [Candidatus Hydrogenedentota bacterium]
MIGLIANSIIYFILSNVLYPETHFLYRMSWSLGAVLALLIVYGLIWKQEKVVFAHNTTMDLTMSKGALLTGVIVCLLTVVLYVVFW